MYEDMSDVTLPLTSVTPKHRSMNVGTKSTLLSLDIANVLFQFFCCYLLRLIHKKENGSSTNQLFVLNLAFSELYANILLTLRDVFNIFIELSDKKDLVRKWFWCLNIYFVTGVCYIYILAMFYITGDRLFHVLLHFKYHAYWNIEKAKKLIRGTWLVNIIISMGAALFTFLHCHHVIYEINLSRILSVYVLSIFYSIFLIFAVVTYVCMFLKYATSRRESMMNPTELRMSARKRRKKPSVVKRKSFTLFNLFIRSKFFTSIVLVLTYLVLTVIPSLVRTMFYLTGCKPHYAFSFWYYVSMRVSYTVDGIIYTFLQKKVIHLVKQRCRVCRRNMIAGENARPSVPQSKTQWNKINEKISTVY